MLLKRDFMKNEFVLFRIKFSLLFINLAYSLIVFLIGFYKLGMINDTRFSFLPFISLFILLNIYLRQKRSVFSRELIKILILNIFCCIVLFFNISPLLEFVLLSFLTVLYVLFIIAHKNNFLEVFIRFRELINILFFLLILKITFLTTETILNRLDYIELKYFVSRGESLMEVIGYLVFIVSVLIYFVLGKRRSVRVH
jgi:hypothetical protein